MGGSQVRARAVRAAVGIACLVPVAIYLVTAVRRIGYPYELEWMEGGAVEIVRRIAHGQAVYTAPSLHYVPYSYTPLYFLVSAVVAHVSGVSFLPLRLVSLLSSLGAFALLFVIVRRATGDRVAGLVATGIYAATFVAAEAWFDIGRVDSMFIALMLASVAVMQRAESSKGGIAAGALATAAFLTKQSALIAMAPLMVALAVKRPRVGLSAVATWVAGVAASSLYLQATSHGWFLYYIYGELAHHRVVADSWRSFFPSDLGPLATSALLATAGLVVTSLKGRGNGERWMWLSLVAGFVGTSWISRLHEGGGQDVLMPAFAALSLTGGLGYGLLSRELSGSGRTPVALVLGGVVALQLAVLPYAPASEVPSASDRIQATGFVSAVREAKGDVIVLNHPWYETMAQKPAWAEGEAVVDVLRAGPGRARDLLVSSIVRSLRDPSVSTVYLDDPGDAATLSPWLERYFRPAPSALRCYQCFFPVTDLPLRPYLTYVRRTG